MNDAGDGGGHGAEHAQRGGAATGGGEGWPGAALAGLHNEVFEGAQGFGREYYNGAAAGAAAVAGLWSEPVQAVGLVGFTPAPEGLLGDVQRPAGGFGSELGFERGKGLHDFNAPKGNAGGFGYGGGAAHWWRVGPATQMPGRCFGKERARG